ncbi:MAG: hypothetical protein ACI9FW_002212 [Flavobacterium sp.]|jgi:hypothetical protein
MRKSNTLLFLLFTAVAVQAQDAVVVSGGNATGIGGSSSYSVGQSVYTTNTDTTGSVLQGVQQAFEIFTLTNSDFTALSLTAVMYPNPATDKIVLSLKNSDFFDLSYVLFDFNGKAIATGLVQQTETPITIQNLPLGVYILKVNQNSTALKAFKIIKK